MQQIIKPQKISVSEKMQTNSPVLSRQRQNCFFDTDFTNNTFYQSKYLLITKWRVL